MQTRIFNGKLLTPQPGRLSGKLLSINDLAPPEETAGAREMGIAHLEEKDPIRTVRRDS
jgi:hypothetical protein